MKAIALISGGIDSPVAAYMMKQKKVELVPVYFDNSPFAGEDTKKRALDSARKLGFPSMKVVPNGKNLEAFAQNCERRFCCLFCKRMMLRIASRIARDTGAQAIVMGDSVAQVASQTVPNLYVESQAADVPVIRPLIGMDKEETIRIAKKIGSYEISTRPATCCGIVPKKPSTSAALEKIVCEESKVDVERLVQESVENAEEISLK
jgi:thiamine biosynthesis protein ThiI